MHKSESFMINWKAKIKNEFMRYYNYIHRWQLTRPELMQMLSFCLSPVAPVRLRRSEPAKSTKWNFAVRVSNSFNDSACSCKEELQVSPANA